jgi:phenylpropionate dioxygenase-like ring-hydroxylating dioxygenase large terminal subunit
VLGTPLVLFRSVGGAPAALLDRCPHRNVPLSLGRVGASGRLSCGYHGWQFDGRGQCREVPGLLDDKPGKDRRCPAYPTLERDGFVWVYLTQDVDAVEAPASLLSLSRPGYESVFRELVFEATLHSVAENALDVPHTAYLHRGLFRGGKKNEIEVHVRRYADRVEAEYRGEPRPPGLAGRILSPSGGVVEHVDRFILPCVAQVEYRLGKENHVIATAFYTPVTDFVTKMFAVAHFKTRLPAKLVKRLALPLGLKILSQDAAILKKQTENVRRFGGEQFMNTEIDVLGQEIWRLLKQAEGREPESAEQDSQQPLFERSLRLLA